MRDRRTTVLLLLLVAAFAFGCGSSDKDEGSGGGGASTTTTTAADAAPDAGKSVVAVQGIYPDKKTKVTGVVYDAKQGLVLTANHAMEAAPSIDVHLADGTLTHARPVARAQCHDLAVIKLFPRPAGIESMPLANSDDVKIGDPVNTMTYLFPESGGKPSLTRIGGQISSLGVEVRWAPLPAIGPLIAHQTSLSAPASGSALMNEKGRMVGLNTLVDHPSDPDTEGISFALPSNYIKQRMGELKPGSGGALGGWENEHNECHHALRKLIGMGHEHDPSSAAGEEMEGMDMGTTDEHSTEGH
jgi:S1-C subfamily serine protease